MNNYPLSQASYLSNRGNVLLKLRRWEAAEKDISAAIDLSPDNAKVAFCICLCPGNAKVVFCICVFAFDQTMRMLLCFFLCICLSPDNAKVAVFVFLYLYICQQNLCELVPCAKYLPFCAATKVPD